MSRGEPHFNWNNSRARIESLVWGSQSHLVLKLALRDNQAVGQSGINIGCHQEQEFWFIKLEILIGSYEKIYSFNVLSSTFPQLMYRTFKMSASIKLFWASLVDRGKDEVVVLPLWYNLGRGRIYPFGVKIWFYGKIKRNSTGPISKKLSYVKEWLVIISR